MESQKISFNASNQQYTIWFWKGDYLNLGAGAEIGLYIGDDFHRECATEYNLTMRIDLYLGNECIITHSDETWWITGFNPEYHQVDASELYVGVKIDFSQYPELWNGFVDSGYSQVYYDNDNKIATIWW